MCSTWGRPGVRASEYGYALDFAPLPTLPPAQRATTRACPDGQVPEDGFDVANAGVARGFGPGIPVTRGQVAGLLARTLDLGVEAGRLSPPTS